MFTEIFIKSIKGFPTSQTWFYSGIPKSVPQVFLSPFTGEK